MTTETQYNIKILYNSNNEKLCSKCKNYYPLDFYHSNGYDNKGIIKLRGECKSCRKVSNRRNYLKRTKTKVNTKNVLDDVKIILDSDDEKKLLELIENEDKCKILLKLLDKVTHNK